jgi:hypothetical protein
MFLAFKLSFVVDILAFFWLGNLLGYFFKIWWIFFLILSPCQPPQYLIHFSLTHAFNYRLINMASRQPIFVYKFARDFE